MKHCYNSDSLHHEFIREYLTGLSCARSLTVLILYENEEWEQLLDLEFNPLDYNGINEARDSLAATALLSKSEFLPIKVDRRKAALSKFVAAEQDCRETNRRIYRGVYSTPSTATIMSIAARLIDKTLGNFDAEEFVDTCNFGPGATTSLPRRCATSPNKYKDDLCITAEAYDFVSPWFQAAYPHWDTPLVIKGHSKIVTVPKNAKTDRTIAIEPALNLWFQKGVGGMIRRRLRAGGIDLSRQSINQERSRIASKYNQLATVDFSSASDTISSTLVLELLPQRWYCVLNALRSRYGLLDGEIINFHKFSSMGNGFTFELETLIFWSLAVACTQHLGLDLQGITVYGDDVILPVGAYDLYASVCKDLGFRVNRLKSYSQTYYRESCGSHYWNGIDIKPIFLKESLSGKTQLVKFANSVRRYAHSRNTYGCDIRLLHAYEVLVAPLKGFPRISDGFGDCGLIENIDHPTVRLSVAKHSIEGYYVRLWSPVAEMSFYNCKGLWLSKLKVIGSTRDTDVRPDLSGIGNDIPIPCRTKLTRTRMLIPQWIDLGPWI